MQWGKEISKKQRLEKFTKIWVNGKMILLAVVLEIKDSIILMHLKLVFGFKVYSPVNGKNRILQVLQLILKIGKHIADIHVPKKQSQIFVFHVHLLSNKPEVKIYLTVTTLISMVDKRFQ